MLDLRLRQKTPRPFLTSTQTLTVDTPANLRHESCELALEGLGYASAPALRDGLGHRIGEDFLFSFLQPIEDAYSGGLGRGFHYLGAAVHIGVDGAEDDGMHRHALAGQERSERLRQIERGGLRKGVGGNDGQGSEPRQGQVADGWPLWSNGKNACVTFSKPRKLTARCCSSRSRLLRSS